LILIKVLLLYCLAFSQAVAGEAVLTEIAARLAKTPIAQGDFYQQKHLKVLHKPLISTGTFTYHQSKGVIWKTLTPVVSLLLVNESRLLTGQGEQAVPAAFGKVFKAMLGGDLAALTDGFAITGTDQKTVWQLELTPKDEMLKKLSARWCCRAIPSCAGWKYAKQAAMSPALLSKTSRTLHS